MKTRMMKKYALSKQGAKDFIMGCVVTALQNIICLLPVGILYLLIADVLEGRNIQDHFSIFVAGCVISMVLILIFGWLQYETTYMATYRESGVRRIAIAEKLRKVPLAYFGKRDLSDFSETMMADCQALEVGFSHNMPTLAGSIVSTVILGIGLFVFDVRMGLAAFWVIPAALLLVFASGSVHAGKDQQVTKYRLASADGIQEYLEALRDLKECGVQEIYIEGLLEKIAKAECTATKRNYNNTVVAVLSGIVLKVGIVSVTLAGVALMAAGEISPLKFILYLIVAGRIYDPLQSALQNIVEINALQVNISRMNEILNYPEQEGSEELHPEGYDITFDHVGFSYDGEESVLHDVSFTAKQGEITALVGPSGGGKTTVARLVMRFWDANRGNIFVGGTDILDVAPEKLMSLYSMVFQNVQLFDDTIFENIRIGRKDASDEEVLKAARLANCDEIAAKFPGGWNERIGENGTRLSGGERQRISIARAILKDAPIILLDEATASLDVENESVIQEAISRLITNKTVLVIAHRMRTIINADKVVVLKEGTVAEEGCPQELLQKDSIFSEMVKMQGIVQNG